MCYHKSILMSRGGERVGLVAFTAFNASSFAVADVWLLADASCHAGHLLAFRRDLRLAVDHVGQWSAACGHAVQSSTDSVVDVHLTVSWAFVDWLGFHHVGLLTLTAFNAFSFAVADVWFLADARRLAGHFLAFLGNLGHSVDYERQRGAAGGHAVQSGADSVIDVCLAVGGAFLFWLSCQNVGERAITILHRNALAHGVLEESFLAEASNDALTGARLVWCIGVVAGGWASGAAGVEDFVFTALLWWQCHEVLDLDLWALGSRHAAAIAIAQMTLFASAAWDADSRADRVGLRAGAIATFALTVFLVLLADTLWWHGEGFSSRHTALNRWNADAVFVLQVARCAEAAHHALLGADGARTWVGAGWGAGRSAGHEDLVFLALGDLRRVGEEHVGLGSIALFGTNADATRVTHHTSFAEASDDALTSAGLIRSIRVGAGSWAGRAAWVEFLVVGALGIVVHGHWDGNGDIVVGLGFTIFNSDAFTISIFQVSFLTETAADTLEGTNRVWFGVGAVRNAGRSTLLVFGIGTAFFNWKSRDGDSEPESTNAEQQRESKARVHR
jgi:hypothetical protein